MYTLQSYGYVCDLLSLPDELLLMVLSNLDQKDLVKCMLVCRRLFHVASDATLCKYLLIPKLFMYDSLIVCFREVYPASKVQWHL